MIRAATLVPLLSLFYSPALAAEPKAEKRPAAELFSAGLDQAKSQGKKVFLLFGSPG